MARKDDDEIRMRLPAELKRRLKAVASTNGRSLNAEALARIERSFGDDDEARQKAFRLMTEALKTLDRGTRR